MAFHINKINRDKVKEIDEDIKARLELAAKRKRIKKDDSPSEFTTEEYQQMYDRKLFARETPLTEVKCRQCGKVKECTKTSNFYYNKVCSNCMRKINAGKGTINL